MSWTRTITYQLALTIANTCRHNLTYHLALTVANTCRHNHHLPADVNQSNRTNNKAQSKQLWGHAGPLNSSKRRKLFYTSCITHTIDADNAWKHSFSAWQLWSERSFEAAPMSLPTCTAPQREILLKKRRWSKQCKQNTNRTNANTAHCTRFCHTDKLI